MPAHARNIQPLIKGCIRYLVDMNSAHQPLKDYWYYNNKIKSELKQHALYEETLHSLQLKREDYGVNYRVNKAD
jgi:hypothetical protein